VEEPVEPIQNKPNELFNDSTLPPPQPEVPQPEAQLSSQEEPKPEQVPVTEEPQPEQAALEEAKPQDVPEEPKHEDRKLDLPEPAATPLQEKPKEKAKAHRHKISGAAPQFFIFWHCLLASSYPLQASRSTL